MRNPSKRGRPGHWRADPANKMERTKQAFENLYGPGARLGLPGSGDYAITLPSGEKRIPLGMIFHDPRTGNFEFTRSPGVDLQEFILAMRRLMPNYGK